MTVAKTRRNLTLEEVKRLLQDFPPILRPQDLAEILKVARKTIYLWIEQGRLNDAARKRGKHWLIARDKAIDVLFNGADW